MLAATEAGVCPIVHTFVPSYPAIAFPPEFLRYFGKHFLRLGFVAIPWQRRASSRTVGLPAKFVLKPTFAVSAFVGTRKFKTFY